MTKIAQELGKVFTVAALALLGQLVLNGLLSSILEPIWADSTRLEAMLPPLALGSLLMVLALWAPARWSRLPRRSLFWALFLAIFGLGVFLTHVEAAVYLILTTDQLLFGFASGTLNALWLAWLMATTYGGGTEGSTDEPLPAHSTIRWRLLALSTFAYLILYLSAGFMIYPQIEDYYATQHIPPLRWLLALQIVRGALYVIFVLGLIRSSTLGRGATALAMAWMFPVLAGLASLLIPNPLMPDVVRYWHMLEIGVSNFVFGAMVGFLFWPGRPTADSPVRQAANGSHRLEGERATL